MATTLAKESWADDVEEGEVVSHRGFELFVEHPQDQLKNEDYFDEKTGIRTIIEYTVNEDGKKVKITRKIKRTLQKSLVEHAVAERKKWAKFGKEKNNKPGPDRATTTIGEAVSLKLQAGGKKQETEESQEDKMKSTLTAKGAGKVVCRLCKGAHFTAKCPYKDSLGGIEDPAANFGEGDELPSRSGLPDASNDPGASAGGKYVPPSMRAGARGPGEMMGGRGMRGEDLPTLRVTNVSEDTTDQDLRDLFSNFGRVARVYIGRDRETGQSKGYAFVSFEDRAQAEKAMQKVHGMGYDNLILNCQWSQPREQR